MIISGDKHFHDDDVLGVGLRERSQSGQKVSLIRNTFSSYYKSSL